MSAHRSPLARSHATPTRAAFEEAARLSVAKAQPSLGDILSVWPVEQRAHLVLWVLLGPGDEVAVAARFREHALSGASRELSRSLRCVHGDVPVVVEREDGRTMVVPFRALAGGA